MGAQGERVGDAFFDWAARAPHAPALVDDGDVVSYGRLAAAVGVAATRLRDAGCAPGTRVGVKMRSRAAARLAVALALARLGATQAILPTRDDQVRREVFARHVGLDMLVGDDDGVAMMGLSFLGLRGEDLLPVRDDAPPPPPPQGEAQAPWIIVQTSGTSGDPKAIPISHASEIARARRLEALFAARPGERVHNMFSLDFFLGLQRAVRALCEGATLVMSARGLTAGETLQLVDRHGVTQLSCSPGQLAALVGACPARGLRLPGLRQLRCSSAALAPALLAAARQRLTPNIFVNYSSNEQGALTAATPEMLEANPACVGRPLPGVELEVVDDAGAAVPPGVTGHVRVRGDGMHGALGRDAPADGWHAPGDSARWDEHGFLVLQGRTDELINYDGMLTAPAEIEEVLLRHPAVAEAAAFAVPSDAYQDAPAVAVVLRSPAKMADLAAHCKAALGLRAPLYYLAVGELPRNAMGKVLRRELAARLRSQLGLS